MVALMVLLVGFMAMVQLIATSVVVNRYAYSLTSLTQLASEKLEELRTLPLTDPRFRVAGNPNYPTESQTALGSLTVAQSQNLTDTTGVTHSEPFYDFVVVNRRNGSITRTAGPDDSGLYNSITRTLGGTTTSNASSSSPTTVSYERRWMVEGNQPIAGVFRITVELSAPRAAGNSGYRQVIRLRAVR